MNELITTINEFLWGSFLIALLLGTGIYFTFKLKFVQIRKFSQGIRRVTGGANLNGKAADKDGMSSFQALATAVAAQVGTGNLAGAATAIASGGPGAIFWMWLSAFFGMATIYAEAVLGQVFKTRKNDQVTGGPAYYIHRGLGSNKKSKALAVFFALACIASLGFMGNAVQANSISAAFNNAFGVSPLITGIAVALMSGFVFFGGLKRIASFTEKVVPVMAGLYIVTCVFILLWNFESFIPALSSIFIEAFSPRAVVGGALGVAVKKSIRYGVARGLFSNEAGMGSTPHAHAIAKVPHPNDQGTVAIVTVFIDTFIVLTCTALVILSSNIDLTANTGIVLTQSAFEATLGIFGRTFIAICLFFFAFSTIVGWYFFGEANIRFLFKSSGSIAIYRVLVMALIVLGSLLNVELAWELSDLFNGLMVLPNLIALLALSGLVKEKMEESENLVPEPSSI